MVSEIESVFEVKCQKPTKDGSIRITIPKIYVEKHKLKEKQPIEMMLKTGKIKTGGKK